MIVYLGTLWSPTKQIKASYTFDWEHGIALHPMQARGLHLAARGKSHGFSQVAAGTWGIFSSWGGDDPSKPVFVKRHQESYLVMRNTAESP